jgi:hypothetical protein
MALIGSLQLGHRGGGRPFLRSGGLWFCKAMLKCSVQCEKADLLMHIKSSVGFWLKQPLPANDLRELGKTGFIVRQLWRAARRGPDRWTKP